MTDIDLNELRQMRHQSHLIHEASGRLVNLFDKLITAEEGGEADEAEIGRLNEQVEQQPKILPRHWVIRGRDARLYLRIRKLTRL